MTPRRPVFLIFSWGQLQLNGNTFITGLRQGPLHDFACLKVTLRFRPTFFLYWRGSSSGWSNPGRRNFQRISLCENFQFFQLLGKPAG
jgi:hypothetical protein